MTSTKRSWLGGSSIVRWGGRLALGLVGALALNAPAWASWTLSSDGGLTVVGMHPGEVAAGDNVLACVLENGTGAEADLTGTLTIRGGDGSTKLSRSVSAYAVAPGDWAPLYFGTMYLGAGDVATLEASAGSGTATATSNAASGGATETITAEGGTTSTAPRHLNFDVEAGAVNKVLVFDTGPDAIDMLRFVLGGSQELRINRILSANGQFDVSFVAASPHDITLFFRNGPALGVTGPFLIIISNPDNRAHRLAVTAITGA